MILPGTPIGPFGRHVEPEDVYRNNPAVSNSSLNTLIWNEWMFYQQHVLKASTRPDSKALTFGRAFHCLLLEPQDFINRFAIWTGSSRRTKEWSGFELSEQQGQKRDIIDADDHETMQRMAESLGENKEAYALVSECDKEVVFRHMCGGNLARQCRVDGISPFGGIIDLKSCESIEEFRANFMRYGYHRQAWWYSTLVQAVTGSPVEAFTFVVCEKKPPFRCEMFVPDPWYLAKAETECMEAMARLEDRLANGGWIRSKPGVQVLEPPRYAA